MSLAKPRMGLWLVLAAMAAGPALAQVDDFRTRQLMNDVAELQRLVRQQSQRIDQLERQLSRLSAAPGAKRVEPEGAPPPAADQAWLAPGAWDRVRTGMTAQEVFDILGVPTAVRDDGDTPAKILFYTLPVGDSGFLSGTIELENDRVRAITRPTLK